MSVKLTACFSLFVAVVECMYVKFYVKKSIKKCIICFNSYPFLHLMPGLYPEVHWIYFTSESDFLHEEINFPLFCFCFLSSNVERLIVLLALLFKRLNFLEE